MEKKNVFFDTPLKKRTDGDGMESSILDTTIETERNFQQSPPSKLPLECLKKTKSRLIELTPRTSNLEEKKKYNSKEAKFIPYEPYKAAVKAILPKEVATNRDKKKPSKNNLDLSVLVAQMSLMDTKPVTFKKSILKTQASSTILNISNTRVVSADTEKENMQLKSELSSLRTEYELTNGQLKQQVQVNKELKTMLVASMGEDLETRVQSLTEDKRQLASALLSSAQHLSTHQEQTEWLAGQCEVWRSKFLASSLMVEELASWKVLLNQRTEALQLTMRQMLEERCRVRDMLLYMYRNLQQLHDDWLENVSVREINASTDYGLVSPKSIGNINLNTRKLQTTNILDLASVNLKLLQNLCSSLGENSNRAPHEYDDLSADTDAEIAAEKLLATPLEISNKNLPLSALVGHAYANSGGTPSVACCVHCNGQVQLL